MRSLYLASLGALLSIQACTDTAAPAELVDPEVPDAAAATVTHDVFRDQFSDVITVPCIGETIAADFFFNTVVHTTMNRNRFVMNLKGAARIRGVGLSTGTLFEGNGPFQETISGSLVNGQFSHTQVLRNHLVSHGSANNFTLSLQFHVTVNAQGETTVEFLRFDEVCR